MRGLAEFVMTGRKQAIIAAGLLGLIPLINLLSPAVVGIVMLRKGLQEATFVFIWGRLITLFAIEFLLLINLSLLL